MNIFGWFTDIFGIDNDSSLEFDDGFSSSNSDPIGMSNFNDVTVNPANGLFMVGGIGGVDVEGNPYGTDFSHDHMTSSGLDDDWLSSSSSSSSLDEI